MVSDTGGWNNDGEQYPVPSSQYPVASSSRLVENGRSGEPSGCAEQKAVGELTTVSPGITALPNPVCYACAVRRIHSSAWLLTVLSAVLQVVIFPLPGLYWLAWIAVTPLLIALLRARPAGALQVNAPVKLAPATAWQGFLLGYLCGILWCGGNMLLDLRHDASLWRASRARGAFRIDSVLHVYRALSRAVWPAGGIGGLPGASLSLRRALVAAPFLWVAVELARTRVTGFPWELLGYAQTGNVALTRIATHHGCLRAVVRNRAGE